MTTATINTKTLRWVYEHLVCEFDHYDCCIVGLVEVDGVNLLCRVEPEYESLPEDQSATYTLHDIAWDAECDEYLEDYRVAYKHWFHPRQDNYDGRSLKWFGDKWQGRNPIEEKAR